MVEPHMYDWVVRESTPVVSMVGDKDIYLVTIGRGAKSRSEIQDSRAKLPQRRPRYAAMIAPAWGRDNTKSELRTSLTLVDSAMTGGPWGDLWGIYFS